MGENKLDILRTRIDLLDSSLVDLLAERLAVCMDIGVYKQEHNLPVVQPERSCRVQEMVKKKAREVNLDQDFILELFDLIQAEAIRLQS